MRARCHRLPASVELFKTNSAYCVPARLMNLILVIKEKMTRIRLRTCDL